MRRGVLGALCAAVLVLSPVTPAWAVDGGALYAERCAGCHGGQGEGSGSFPPLRGSSLLADEQGLHDLIEAGGGGMPAFGYLSDDDVDALVTHLQATWGGGSGDEQSESADAPPGGSPGDAAAGAAVYAVRCASCHGDAGAGRGAYPALTGRPILADAEALEQLIAQGRGGMPGFSDLPPADVAALIAFLQALGGAAPGQGTGAPPDSPTTTAASPVGDAARGERLFTGATALSNGGGACIACHTAGAHGAVRGGALGTDLGDARVRYGSEAAIAGVLENPAFLVMRSAYADAPLDPQEAADIAAYLAGLSPDAAGASVFTDRFWLFGVIAVVVLFAVMGLVSSRRRPGLARQISEARRQGRRA